MAVSVDFVGHLAATRAVGEEFLDHYEMGSALYVSCFARAEFRVRMLTR